MPYEVYEDGRVTVCFTFIFLEKILLTTLGSSLTELHMFFFCCLRAYFRIFSLWMIIDPFSFMITNFEAWMSVLNPKEETVGITSL